MDTKKDEPQAISIPEFDKRDAAFPEDATMPKTKTKPAKKTPRLKVAKAPAEPKVATPEVATKDTPQKGSLASEIEKFASMLAKAGKTEKTVRSYTQDLSVLVQGFAPEKEVAEITPHGVRAWIESDCVQKLRSGKPKNAISTAKILRVARQFFAFAGREELVTAIENKVEKLNG